MFALDSKIWVTKGHKGEKPDEYPATIVSQPEATRVNGRLTRIADVVLSRTTRDGVRILVLEPADLFFAFPGRTELYEILDGTTAQPLTTTELVAKTIAATREFLANRPAAVQAMDLADVPEA
jgi:hypothetical protein